MNRPLDPKYVNNRIKAVMTEAGIPTMGFHKLRHTAATLMLADGTRTHLVRDQFGHSQIALTTNTYGHAAWACALPPSPSLDSCAQRSKG